MPSATYICPSCGSEVRVGGTCAGCGPRPKKAKRKRAKKSWEQDDAYDGLGLDDEEFDYDEFVEREFGSKPHRTIGIAWYWWATALVLAVLMVWMMFDGFR